MIKITSKNKKTIAKVFVFFFAITSFSSLLIYALSKNMVYFYTPTQVSRNEAPLNSYIRVGGMVKVNSFVKSKDSLKVFFKIHDLDKEINVTYEGILPDLFSEENPKLISLMGRPATPQEVAYASLFFASDESSYCTGSVLAVDGGATGRA